MKFGKHPTVRQFPIAGVLTDDGSKSRSRGGTVTDRPVSAQDLLATMCHALQIDYRKEYTTREGRPMTFLGASARPVQEAF